MPELPDLVYIQKKLKTEMVGQIVTDVSIKEPIVLRILLPEKIQDALKGATFLDVKRHGPFLVFLLSHDLDMIVHPMLAGKFKFTSSATKPGRGLCLSFHLKSDKVLHYLDDKKMGKVYFINHGATAAIPRFDQQGVDILTSAFTAELFMRLIEKQRKQVRVFLMTQEILSAIGNAYADEILFDAGIHPKTFCYQLQETQKTKLYDSIRKVMKWGIEQVEKAQQPVEIKVRGHLKIRNRKNQPCPTCGSDIRCTGVLGYDAFFCPKCQPPQRTFFVDWSAVH